MQVRDVPVSVVAAREPISYPAGDVRSFTEDGRR